MKRMPPYQYSMRLSKFQIRGKEKYYALFLVLEQLSSSDALDAGQVPNGVTADEPFQERDLGRVYHIFVLLLGVSIRLFNQRSGTDG